MRVQTCCWLQRKVWAASASQFSGCFRAVAGNVQCLAMVELLQNVARLGASSAQPVHEPAPAVHRQDAPLQSKEPAGLSAGRCLWRRRLWGVAPASWPVGLMAVATPGHRITPGPKAHPPAHGHARQHIRLFQIISRAEQRERQSHQHN